jgi:acyl-CoA reductase-like NAD-dependent aldehyde dehydrogenase
VFPADIVSYIGEFGGAGVLIIEAKPMFLSDEAIVRANKTQFGPADQCGADEENPLTVARSIEAGQASVNTHGVLAINQLAPYGCVKQIGVGRKFGVEGILEHVQSPTITTYEHAGKNASSRVGVEPASARQNLREP